MSVFGSVFVVHFEGVVKGGLGSVRVRRDKFMLQE